MNNEQKKGQETVERRGEERYELSSHGEVNKGILMCLIDL